MLTTELLMKRNGVPIVTEHSISNMKQCLNSMLYLRSCTTLDYKGFTNVIVDVVKLYENREVVTHFYLLFPVFLFLQFKITFLKLIENH